MKEVQTIEQDSPSFEGVRIFSDEGETFSLKELVVFLIKFFCKGGQENDRNEGT